MSHTPVMAKLKRALSLMPTSMMIVQMMMMLVDRGDRENHELMS